MKTIKVRIPVTQLDVIFRDLDEFLLLDTILDLERQLNNLKLVSEVRPIGMYPRFHLGGDYEILSYGDSTHEGRPSLASYQQHELRVSARQRKDSGVPENVKVQSREGAGLSETRGLQIIEETISHFEYGLINTSETFNKIADTVLRVVTADQPGFALHFSNERMSEILKERKDG